MYSLPIPSLHYGLCTAGTARAGTIGPLKEESTVNGFFPKTYLFAHLFYLGSLDIYKAVAAAAAADISLVVFFFSW